MRLNVSREADLYVDQLFHLDGISALTPQFSHHICDVERFRDDCDEPESRRGRGLLYTCLEDGRPFRRYSDSLRQKVLAELYDPHHAHFTREVKKRLEAYGLCWIIDCHSFSDRPGYPDFCIGTDPFHTPTALSERLQDFISRPGYGAQANFPYGGSIVPMAYFQKDQRVKSVMIEVNKRLYLNEATFTKNNAFKRIRGLCQGLAGLVASHAGCK